MRGDLLQHFINRFYLIYVFLVAEDAMATHLLHAPPHPAEELYWSVVLSAKKGRRLPSGGVLEGGSGLTLALASGSCLWFRLLSFPDLPGASSQLFTGEGRGEIRPAPRS